MDTLSALNVQLFDGTPRKVVLGEQGVLVTVQYVKAGGYKITCFNPEKSRVVPNIAFHILCKNKVVPLDIHLCND